MDRRYFLVFYINTILGGTGYGHGEAIVVTSGLYFNRNKTAEDIKAGNSSFDGVTLTNIIELKEEDYKHYREN